MGTLFWVLLISAGLIGISLYAHHIRKQKAIDAGHAAERQGDFFKQRHTFTTKTGNISEIINALDMSVLDEKKVSVDTSSEPGIVIFRNGGFIGGNAPFVSVLEGSGNTGDLFRYDYQIESWSQGSKSGVDTFSANVILTQIEKAFLKLDSSTEVERVAATYKSKTRIF